MREILAAASLVFANTPSLPPVEYRDGDPITVRVTFASPEWVHAECRKRVGREPEPGKVFLACAGVNRRWAIMPNGCLFAEDYAALACHEVGHSRGWAHG